jgi:hypothetical protein
MELLCRHCQKAKVNRPRGLCFGCYYSPGVRDLYPSTSKFARRGAGLLGGGFLLAAAPTTALPGTAEKVRVMEDRAARGESIFHPGDRRHDAEDAA